MLSSVLLLVACHHASEGNPDDSTDSSAPEGPTYYADIRPILDQSCARCHTDGGIAFSMDTPDAVVPMAAAMKAEVTEGLMPPPAPDPSCRDYASSARFTLTDDQRATIADWADAGAPLGDPADAPGARDESLTSLAPYDAELRATTAYTPDFGTDGNDYRCFLLDVGNTTQEYVTGLQALVDNTKIVHHVVIFLPATTDDLWGEGDPHGGFSCGGLGQGNWTALGAWGPGANPTVLPDGVGIYLPANAQLVLQMHYFDSFDGADQESDQSGYGLLLADAVDRVAINYPLGPTSFTIPAGETDDQVRDRTDVPADMDIYSVWPHMHLLGAGFDESLVHGDGSDDDCLLSMAGWDFHNQVTANFLEPVHAARGDHLKITCHYDNSAENPNQYFDPPQDVGFGEGTTDEMCFGFTLVSFDP